MSIPENDSRRVIPSGASAREITLGVIGAVLVIALVSFAVWRMGANSIETGITGTVTEKKFVPREETQITIGGGAPVTRTDVAGQYFIYVGAANSADVYHVLLSEEDFQRVQIGDTYQIPKASLVP